MPFISLLRSRAESLKNIYFAYNKQLGYLEKDGVGGWGVGVNGYAHRYVLILPAKPVFLFFEVKASLGDDSSLRRFTFGRGKCFVEPSA